jgi:hypothetical protein
MGGSLIRRNLVSQHGQEESRNQVHRPSQIRPESATGKAEVSPPGGFDELQAVNWATQTASRSPSRIRAEETVGVDAEGSRVRAGQPE